MLRIPFSAFRTTQDKKAHLCNSSISTQQIKQTLCIVLGSFHTVLIKSNVLNGSPNSSRPSSLSAWQSSFVPEFDRDFVFRSFLLLDVTLCSIALSRSAIGEKIERDLKVQEKKTFVHCFYQLLFGFPFNILSFPFFLSSSSFRLFLSSSSSFSSSSAISTSKG